PALAASPCTVLPLPATPDRVPRFAVGATSPTVPRILPTRGTSRPAPICSCGMAIRRGSARTRAAAPFLAAVLALGLVACSATPTAAPTVEPTIAPPPTPTVVPTESAQPPTEPATPVPSVVSGGVACSPADLKASHDLVEGGAGSRFTNVVLVTASRCSIDAFPAM